MLYKENRTKMLFNYIRSNDIDRVERLISLGADLESIDNGYSPLLLACYNGHYEITKSLIEGGSNINWTSETGSTPLFGAAYSWLLEKNQGQSCFAILLENDADLMIKDHENKTIIDIVKEFNSPISIEILNFIKSYFDNKKLICEIDKNLEKNKYMNF